MVALQSILYALTSAAECVQPTYISRQDVAFRLHEFVSSFVLPVDDTIFKGHSLGVSNRTFFPRRVARNPFVRSVPQMRIVTDPSQAAVWEGPVSSMCQLIIIMFANMFLAGRLVSLDLPADVNRVSIRVPVSTSLQRIVSRVDWLSFFPLLLSSLACSMRW
jgi:hypothetical protein